MSKEASTGFACFVTGTDTEIGKTLVSSALLYALVQKGGRAAGMKPIAAGTQLVQREWHNEDVDSLVAAGNLDLPLELVTPYLFHDAIAPHIAAHREGVEMRLEHILDCYAAIAAQADAVVVEGVGGFRVPLSPGFDTADLAARLALPVVLVVGLRLGCISHALLTAEAIAQRGLPLAGWVANTVDADMPFLAENVDTLRARLPAPLLGVIPRLAAPSAKAAAGFADFSMLPGWPGA
ncbi:dethiobiotin synthase [Eoetvoesiella caeni]|uniref:ATP-dependent dethiobiotin synthetase BioD n=1 Tax=Eoetvoesiella caeni TaxID=645616 RepID=A0A366H9J7_9BURK|nr:dethiobiotin synthase [Eoetvoesiella caeni]MCI2809649.1 dethiobiotin synthase [Eoetvoesiella caeni]NYT56145.1 dethiobiotin synthase [Eoetvoesiella caeni]RBP38910.1 dethiobiotin synthase [Eoetvoesiella caeni]